ncbi:hypothetical protein BV898_09275 [Hypsibius exemplaris]|uniref:Tc1-like transposase DDE domain-containing protein n=1 Tax=Hypsibius exemplaris TaxID=2072580 RepID=A0A1W0WN32_HYPEX|nr:hypothetical protein BV898_09275 [Hypsibius exemplaris]
MIFGAVSFSGQSPFVVLKSGFSLNQHTYKDNCLKPMLEDLSYGLEANSAILYQDKAPCHAAGTVQAFLKEKMPCFIPNADIPSNSPDLNPLDYCVWSLLKERVNKNGLISSFDRLAKILKDEWEAISQQMIQDGINFWMSRVRKVEKARGSYIEQTLFCFRHRCTLWTAFTVYVVNLLIANCCSVTMQFPFDVFVSSPSYLNGDSPPHSASATLPKNTQNSNQQESRSNGTLLLILLIISVAVCWTPNNVYFSWTFYDPTWLDTNFLAAPTIPVTLQATFDLIIMFTLAFPQLRQALRNIFRIQRPPP